MRYDDSLNVLLILINAVVLGVFVLVIVVAENYNINWSEIKHSCPGWSIIKTAMNSLIISMGPESYPGC